MFEETLKPGEIHTPSALHMAENLTNAVRQGLGKEGVPLPGSNGYDYTTPDYKMFESLQKSCYRFSAAKTWQMNKSLTELLHDGDTRRSWSDYEKAAFKELGHFVGPYEKVEYNSVVSSSQMSAKEQRFRENANIMPWLQFKTSKGEHVCPICGPYSDIIRHIDDEFWNYATPLLHYQCNCTKVQLPESKATPSPDSMLPDPELIPKIFRVNYAAKMQAFPPEHPIYYGTPKKSINAWAKEHMPAIPPPAKLPEVDKHGFETIFNHPGGGSVKRHTEVVTTTSDYHIHETIAMAKAKEGHAVEILPEIVPPDNPMRKVLMNGAKHGKNPDLRINGTYVEVKDPKVPLGPNALVHCILDASDQADHALVNIADDKVSEFELFKKANGQLNQIKELISVEFWHRGKFLRFTKK